MTSQPIELGRRYTVDEFVALPEDTSLCYELQEGTLLVSPKPVKPHIKIVKELIGQIDRQLPPDLDVWADAEVRLEGLPATARVPDLIVLDADSLDRPGLVLSSEVHLAIEVLSPSSVRTDTKLKRMEYADAGIPYYWIIDPDRPVTATVHCLVNGEYEESIRAEGVFETTGPCPLRIDLDALLPARLS